MPSILFFLGILMTVVAGIFRMIFVFGNDVMQSGMNLDLFVMLLGGGSAVIDNVPLVAASMGMFQEPLDSTVWHFIAYAAGTGVAANNWFSSWCSCMGMEKTLFSGI